MEYMKKLSRTQDKNIQVGIDIGSSKFCCAIAEIDPSNQNVKLLGVGSCPSSGIKKGSIIHRDKIIEEMEKAVTDAEIMADIKVNRSWLTISGEHVRGINTQGAIAIQKPGQTPSATDQEIRIEDVYKVLELAKAISFPVDRNILHTLPQEYIIDTMNGIKDPVGMSGRRLEGRVHLVTVATSSASNFINCAEELGISVDGLVFQGLASSIATIDKDEKELGVAVVDIGSGTTDIVVYLDGGVRHTGVIPIGSDSITNDIAVMLQVGKKEAEEIKLKYASAKASMASPELEFELPVKNGGISRKISEHELSRYVEARMTEILNLISREISRADIHQKLTYGLVFTGGGAQLSNLAGLAEETLNIRARIGAPKGISGVVDVASTPHYAAAIGLIQWPLHYQDTQAGIHAGLTPGKVFKKFTAWFKEFF
jgi:cell division protein FtsA